jgi:hypothetical protein
MVLGDPSEFNEAVVKELRSSGRSPIFLPKLPAPAFGCLLMAASSRLIGEKFSL